jgi:hypothetical protein
MMMFPSVRTVLAAFTIGPLFLSQLGGLCNLVARMKSHWLIVLFTGQPYPSNSVGRSNDLLASTLHPLEGLSNHNYILYQHPHSQKPFICDNFVKESSSAVFADCVSRSVGGLTLLAIADHHFRVKQKMLMMVCRLLVYQNMTLRHNFLALLYLQLDQCRYLTRDQYYKGIGFSWLIHVGGTAGQREVLAGFPVYNAGMVHGYSVRDTGGAAKVFNGETLAPFVGNAFGHVFDIKNSYRFAGYVAVDDLNPMTLDNHLSAYVPMEKMLDWYSMVNIQKIGRSHSLTFGSRKGTRSYITKELEEHRCTVCPSFVSLFVLAKSNQQASKDKLFHQSVPVDNLMMNILAESNPPKMSCFPPDPASDDLTSQIMTDWCAATTPQELEEAGCAVCGLLTLKTKLSPLRHVRNMLGILDSPGLTRTERLDIQEKVSEIQGPVIDKTCSCICNSCREKIRVGCVPKNALANGLWIGEVPNVLKELTYVEQLLVRRVRLNGCFVRVSTGMRKMVAHAIAFESPVAKVYDKLPPPQSEMGDVLVILFSGPNKPTKEDWKRTPVLVRRTAVLNALTWLKLNNSLYNDIEIDMDALATYPEDSPPVGVEYRESYTNKSAESVAQNDDGADDGTESGPCPFVLHGLTGPELKTLTVKEQIAKALNHLDRHGAVLSVGHGAEPISIFNSPELYPGAFPWLFPYGKGGVGNGCVPEERHIRHLLMYHDKRFQKDPTFCFMAFSHSQVKKASQGGFLSVQKKNFADMSKRLLNVNQQVLGSMAQRVAEGKTFSTSTEEEKECYRIISDLGHVDGRVSGSVTTKRYMRSEIWSLISYLGAPSWYVTLSPADQNSPISLYYADTKEEFKPQILPDDVRRFLIASNPTAAARFFDFMVKMFIKHILGVGSGHNGLFGDTAGYYGTVEQQGRLTLHLHMLLFIRGARSPQEIHDSLLDKSSEFASALIRYLESCHSAEVLSGEDVQQIRDQDIQNQESPTYVSPMETLPQAPVLQCLETCGNCQLCKDSAEYWMAVNLEIDTIIAKAQVHTCRSTFTKNGSRNKKFDFTGCLDNKYGVCSACFP